jgi:hypothetical protein
MHQLKVSLLSVLGGPCIEVLYFRDYWHPESVFSFEVGPFRILIEDFFFAFSFSGIAAILYPVLWQKKFVVVCDGCGKKSFVHGILFATVVVFSIAMLNASLNSIYVTAFFCEALTLIVAISRRDLWMPALYGGMLTAGLLILVYSLGFVFIQNTEDILKAWWYLYGQSFLGIRICRIPLTEIVWGFAYGSMTSVLMLFWEELAFQNNNE